MTFRRVQYDFEQTIKKIYDTPDLDNFWGPVARRTLGLLLRTQKRFRRGQGRHVGNE